METNLHNYLQGIADAIKEKTGDTTINAQDFASKIASIEGGGSEPTIELERKDVNFYDYDGTLLFSYTLAEAQALTELPTPKGHEGLVFQGWNWDYEDVIALDYPMDIGAMYVTDDGKTRLYISIVTNARMNVPICFNQTITNGVIVDWGDGSATETYEGKGAINTSHTYAKVGDYCITLEAVDSCILKLGYGNAQYCIMGENTSQISTYKNMLHKVELGRSTELLSNAFDSCRGLKNVSMTKDIGLIPNQIFRYADGLEFLAIPKYTSIFGYLFAGATRLMGVAMPKKVDLIQTSWFQGCTNLNRISLPQGITKIDNTAFYQCDALTILKMPSNVSTIGLNAFYACYSIKVMDFRNHTSIPTLTGAITNIAADCKIVVPDALYDAWIAATNWSSSADKIVKSSEYTD